MNPGPWRHQRGNADTAFGLALAAIVVVVGTLCLLGLRAWSRSNDIPPFAEIENTTWTISVNASPVFILKFHEKEPQRPHTATLWYYANRNRYMSARKVTLSGQTVDLEFDVDAGKVRLSGTVETPDRMTGYLDFQGRLEFVGERQR